MRIISGTARGKKLTPPKDDAIRPTSDRVKESLFNILGRKVYGARFLDLFSGSGAIGIEAISRGAAWTVLVDRDTRLIQDNLSSCKFDKERYSVLESDIKNNLRLLKEKNQQFDLIFMDPPYGFSDLMHIISGISEDHLLSENGILVVESEKKDSLPEQIATLKKYDERMYSITKLSFFEGKKYSGEDSSLSGKL